MEINGCVWAIVGKEDNKLGECEGVNVEGFTDFLTIFRTRKKARDILRTRVDDPWNWKIVKATVCLKEASLWL